MNSAAGNASTTMLKVLMAEIAREMLALTAASTVESSATSQLTTTQVVQTETSVVGANGLQNDDQGDVPS